MAGGGLSGHPERNSFGRVDFVGLSCALVWHLHVHAGHADQKFGAVGARGGRLLDECCPRWLELSGYREVGRSTSVQPHGSRTTLYDHMSSADELGRAEISLRRGDTVRDRDPSS